MNYVKIYSRLIEKRKVEPVSVDVYREKHHILPKSMGGSDDECNLVYLTAREHFIAHWLLWRIHRNMSMAWAFSNMCGNPYGKRQINSHAFEESRKALSITMTGIKRSDEFKKNLSLITKGRKHTDVTKKKISESRLGEKHHMYGKSLSEEHRRKISESNKGKKHTDDARQKMSELRKGKKGVSKTEEQKKRISEIMKNRPHATCTVCGKSGYNNNLFTKHHFDNCKY